MYSCQMIENWDMVFNFLFKRKQRKVYAFESRPVLIGHPKIKPTAIVGFRNHLISH